jgi:hypothetical protein
MSTPQLGTLVNGALLAELQKRFPNRAPDLTTPDREVWASAGEQRLIDFLQREYDDTHGGRADDF